MRRQNYTVETCPPPDTARTLPLIACRIALKYPNRIPTYQELMRDTGMSRANAFRWVAAFKVARGEC